MRSTLPCVTPRQQPEQQAPPVQRLRVRYAKRGRARFTSHRDFCRAFERALRRADVPMAYSSGFNPHPRISYANASPTGAATEAEYLEIGLARECEPDAVRAALGVALPTGLDIVTVVVAEGRGLAEQLTASEWLVGVPGLGRDVLQRGVDAVLAASEVEVQRMMKSGLRTFDARGSILALEVVGDGELRLASQHGEPLVRPDDVLQALASVDEACRAPAGVSLTRLHQGEWRDGEVVDPF